MKRYELSIAVSVALALMAAGFTWLYDGWGLVGAGVALLVALFFIDIKEE